MPLRRAQGESCHSQQVVGGAHHIGGELRLRDPDEAALSHVTHGVHPTEDFLDSLALSLVDAVALVVRGATDPAPACGALQCGRCICA